MNQPLVVTAATVLVIVLSAFFVVIEFALLGARRHRLEALAPESRAARAALRGVHELTIMLALAQLGITACTFALGALTKPAIDRWLGPVLASWGLPGWVADSAAFALSLLFVTFLHLVIGEMAPKSWAIAHPERAAVLIGPPSRALARVFRPLLRWINTMANRLVAASGVTPVDRAAAGGRDIDTIRHLVEHSASVGTLEASARAQLADVLDLQGLRVGDLLPARRGTTTVAADAVVGDVWEAASRSAHMRVLVDAGDAGVPRLVHVRDVLLEPADRPVGAFTRPVLTLPVDLPVYEALSRMRAAGEQLVVATDAGRSVGVLTVTDILRRILPRQDAAPRGDENRPPGASA
ncbi:CNNM domain-containing protein [Streptomyces spiramenti]|uniref:HlyC/CorC family transporter n=1 Tax=Streptomyces spiramenti TaxID=2720606 RepID=A0ABX1AGF1_9ACTN|nr:hemolysin family protein [Streptomyces spiramenti]NJP65041.1 HlyC/CorC family transporter [Streptomyces spiramenti]